MRDREIQIAQAAIRMRDFSKSQDATFPASSVGGQKFAALSALVDEIEEHGASQALAHGAAKASTGAKKVSRAEVRRQMRAYRETAIALETKHPGISQKFRIPSTNGDQALINAARAFVEAATPFQADFIDHEMPASFLEDLTAAVDAFESDVTSYNQNREQRISATASLKNALRRVIRLKKELDPIVHNKLRNDPASLAAWESASHIERATKKAGSAEKTPPPPQP